ncbi:metal ABC transporter permease [Thiohalomonas denitrificans]|uniref:Zinc transport system permease protein n=1 Tax=Thiohalomonas denitrificans TaxID=415747 RepID=A0A1G5Q486_9GAMM|nr:metal ABC transporter permease [Thiohalomonas denitrificans]SCZ56270.1 zinc transport system permease protein [Thiohalomonas denitrificans]
MNPDALIDPLFQTPFLVGLILAAVLPIVGVLLRLRNEWLAALGLAHLSGASALAGLAFGIPAVAGAPVGAVAGALLKTLGRFRGNSFYAVMILVGWSATLLLATNTILGSSMGHALIEGQIYFAGTAQLLATSLFLLSTIALLPKLMPYLIRAEFFPALGHNTRHRFAWRWPLAFDLLAALGMAVGTGTIGLMGAFALVFLPAWLAFRTAPSWRGTLIIALVTGTLGYLMAFALALYFDQPFGPVLVALLFILMALIEMARHFRSM